MKVSKIKWIVLSVLFLTACSVAPKNDQQRTPAEAKVTKSSAKNEEAMPVEAVEIKGTIRGLGGESDVYYIVDRKLGKIFLDHFNPSAYWGIRNNEGVEATLYGTWNEREEKDLYFNVIKVNVLRPVETQSLEGKIRGVGGESDVYYIVDKKLGKVFLEHGNHSTYEDIRSFIGRKARFTGRWDERQEDKLVFTVDAIELLSKRKVKKNK